MSVGGLLGVLIVRGSLAIRTDVEDGISYGIRELLKKRRNYSS